MTPDDYDFGHLIGDGPPPHDELALLRAIAVALAVVVVTLTVVFR